MFQRRPHSPAPRTRSLALGGALAALAVVGGGTVVAVSAPTGVAAGDIMLAQNATGQDAGVQDPAAEDATAQEMELGVPVNLDLEPVVARAAGGTIPAGTSIQVTGLPDGLTQDGWVISGTPTRAGDYEVLVTVSNGPVSESEKLTVTVVDPSTATVGDEEATTTPAATADPAPTTAPDAATTTAPDAATTTAQPAPTLSAVPGIPAADAVEPDGSELDSTDDETGTTPDLCAALGDGEVDGASVGALLPALTGGGDAETSGLLLVLVNAVVNMLPSILGDSGSTQDLGSAGQILCTLSPSLLGGESSGGADAEATGGAALGSAPAALLGMFTTGAGSLGD
ncbi:hypothetical protein CEY15_09035 [Dietzia natronolimnaea]|uniref:Uncharacterized protein n=1 Tax=Dietzia natronolimnaea TaxID=161920 RepID=A0A2A2WQ79_9ACTN|nr:hypothetical protein [Dietzia natronolimnaea]PAY23193.1 hypothetical protein CEY15_09035 [Dietzia natronolimnaea]